MNIRTAILKAADSIEQNPSSYDFMQGTESIGPQRDGCLLVWIGHFAGVKKTSMFYSNDVAEILGLTKWQDFIGRLDVIGDERMAKGGKWLGYERPEDAPRALRLYADKYHPDAIPESVMAIFNTEVCHVDIS